MREDRVSERLESWTKRVGHREEFGGGSGGRGRSGEGPRARPQPVLRASAGGGSFAPVPRLQSPW